MLSNEEIENILNNIYFGIITEENLPLNLYLSTGQTLKEAIEQGFAQTLQELSPLSDEFELLQSLQINSYKFSAGKTFQNVFELRQLAKELTFDDYKVLAKEIYRKYNKVWLATEKDTSIGMTQMAREWIDIEKDQETFPFLQYQTMDDDRVRPAHAALDNIIKPVNDPFWDDNLPLNGYNCRCRVIQLEEGEITDTTNIDLSDTELYPKQFRHNPGKTGYVFKTEGHNLHPYMKVPEQYHDLRDRNFNLPIPV